MCWCISVLRDFDFYPTWSSLCLCYTALLFSCDLKSYPLQFELWGGHDWLAGIASHGSVTGSRGLVAGHKLKLLDIPLNPRHRPLFSGAVS